MGRGGNSCNIQVPNLHSVSVHSGSNDCSDCVCLCAYKPVNNVLK